MIDVLDIVAVTLPSLGKIERCTSPHSLSHGTCGGVSHLSTTDRAAGCMQRVLEPFMFRMEVVPLSPSPTQQRSVERDLEACKRLARCTACRWRLHTLFLCILATERRVHFEKSDQHTFLWKSSLRRRHGTHRFINTGQQKVVKSRNRLTRSACSHVK